MSNRSGTKYSAPTDANRRPTLIAVSTVDQITPVPLEADPVTGRLLVNATGFAGSKTNNNAAPGSDNVGVLGAVSTAAAPSYTEGNLVALSTDLSGQLRVTGSLSVGGTTDNSAFTAGTSTGTPAMGFYHSVIDTVTDGRSAAIAITPKRAQHTNLRDASGNELGISSAPLQVSLANTGANATAVKVDGSGVTQPVSGSVTANIGTTNGLALDATLTGGSQKTKLVDSAGTNLASISAAGALKVDGSAVTQPISAASLPLPTGAAQDSTLTGGSQKTKLVDSGGTNVATISAAGAVKVDGSAVTQPVSLTSTTITGTVAVTESGSWNVGTTSAAINVGQTTSAATAVQLTASSIASTNGILVQALAANTANVYIGASGVTTSTGFELQPGQAVPFTCSNINLLYVVGSNTSDKVCWTVL